MNNWPIIAFVVVAFLGLAFVFAVILEDEKRRGHSRAVAEVKQEYQELLVNYEHLDHEQSAWLVKYERLAALSSLDLCYIDGLEQEIEQMTTELNTARAQCTTLHHACEVKNEQVKVLVETLNVQHVEIESLRQAREEKENIDVTPETPMAANGLQHTAQTRITRNTKKREGTTRKERGNNTPEATA